MIQRLHLNDNKLFSWTYKDPIIFNHNSQIKLNHHSQETKLPNHASQKSIGDPLVRLR